MKKNMGWQYYEKKNREMAAIRVWKDRGLT